MGLISEYTEVGLCSKNISYYENLGYEIPRVKSNKGMVVSHGTKINVKVSDLPYASHTKVKICCDCCGEVIDVIYNNYCNHNHNGLYYCKNCANSILLSGENHHRWRFDKSDEERINERRYPEYISFVKAVLARDNYTCQCCGKNHSTMEVHHLDGYSWCIEKRTDVTNGITLCPMCHSNFHQKYGKIKNEKWQYMEWLGIAQLELKKYDNELPTARQVYDVEEDKVYCSAIEYAKIHKINHTNVYNCCNHKVSIQKYINKNEEVSFIRIEKHTVCGHHVLWYDEYLQMSDNDLQQYLQQPVNRSFIKVICITTGKIFSNIKEASRYCDGNNVTIGLCCKGLRKTSGKLNGIPLQWMYLSDFEKLSKEEQKKLLTLKESENNDNTRNVLNT